MAKLRVLFYYLFEVINSLLLCLVVILSIARLTIFNEKYIIKVFENNNYYEYVDKEIREDMSNVLIPSQLPADVLIDIYNIDEVKQDTNMLVKNIYENKNVNVDITDISSKLKANINQYLHENNIEVLEEDSIDKIIKQMTDIYIEKITQANIYKTIGKIVSKIYKYIDIIIISITAIFILLYLLSRKIYKDNNISLSLLISSFLTIFIVKYININININNIFIWNDNISAILHDIINNIFSYISITSYILIALGILIIALKKEKKETK